MFYSHEILTSPRNGVSTIWLAATIGPKSTTRKIPRKVIQGVNIPKACGEDDCQITIPNDPAFELDFRLPDFDIDLEDGQDGQILSAYDDWGIEIDAEGNIISGFDEPELEPLPQLPIVADGMAEADPAYRAQMPGSDIHMDLGKGDIPSLSIRQNQVQRSREPQSSAISTLPIRQRPTHRRACTIRPDAETKVSKADFRLWATGYASVQDAIRKDASVSSTPTLARKNARYLLFGRGLMDVGTPTAVPGFVHPLSSLFAGSSLAKVLGVELQSLEIANSRKRRRLAAEAFSLEGEGGRRVRQRVDEGDHAGESMRNQAQMPFMVETEVELGREPGSALSDILSSVPWNRAMSAALGSSVPGSAKAGSSYVGRRVSASPLQGRGSAVQDLERLSESSVALGLGETMPIAADLDTAADLGEEIPGRELIQEANDREDNNFMDFLERMAKEKGRVRGVGGSTERGLLWVEFDDLFQPQDRKKPIVTQAFYNVLSLATRNLIALEQDGEDIMPFGTIRVGVLIVETGASD
ncbi:hypothetical protein VTK73DRAFT_2769 [Phialemonium thermophilum]|uniref:Rad21/Rec8-like protein N-terminal domain-containing protein n=1 Tax=Phialemonium thermophilum TaxID=223376 RepID=A0ABR3Y190_9PEZI